MRTVLLHNPTAGTEGHSRDLLLSALRLAGLSGHYCSVKDDDFDAALRRSSELVMVAGGDGTVAKVIARLSDRSIPIAILPLGTANNIARSMGIVGAPLELAETLRLDRSRRLDIGSAQGPWGHRRFVEAVGLGPLAQAIEKGSKRKSNGADRLRKSRRLLQRLLRKADVLNIEIRIDGETVAGDILAVEILNVVYTGPALPLAPGADPGDGKLDVVCIPASRRKDVASWIEAPHEAPPPVVTEQGRKVVITGEFPHQRVDDEVFDPAPDQGTITLELEHEAAKILVPPKEIVGKDLLADSA
jgi:diacylglycerol kinase family enzyme